MATKFPTSDFVTTALSGAIISTDTTMTIGTGLDIPATNGVLQIDYDSVIAVGTDSGPESIFYTAYNTGTGAITGMTRGIANTDAGGNGVAHADGASIQCAPSAYYFQQFGTDIVPWTTWVPSYAASGSMTVNTTSTTAANYCRIGNIVYFVIYFALTTAGTASTAITFTLPVECSNGYMHGSCSVRDATSGGFTGLGHAYINSGSAGSIVSVFKNDSSNWTLAASRFVMASGFYRVA